MIWRMTTPRRAFHAFAIALAVAAASRTGGTARAAEAHEGDGWRALPRGAAGLAPDRPHIRPVRELYFPGLQDPPPGHDGRNAGGGR